MVHRAIAAALAVGVSFAAFAAGPALADIKVGYTLSATGSAAALGVPQKNGVALLPKEIAGEKIEYIVLDDASDGTKAVANARKMITEDKIDVLVGSSIAPTSFPLVDIAAENKLPLIAITASTGLIAPMDDKRHWVFKVVQNDSLMANAVADEMQKRGVKTVGFIGFNDAYGDGWYKEFSAAAEKRGIKIVAKEAFARADTSVTGQTLKLIAAKPDVVLVAASGTPAVLPQKALKERGYKGQIYQTHGISTKEFIRVGGKDVESTIFPAGPFIMAEKLPDDSPVKPVALDTTNRYIEIFNQPPAAFAAHSVDAVLLLQAAIPVALKVAKPGTPEFRVALRDALENVKDVPLNHGVTTMTPTDHNGFDERARVMVVIRNGEWELLED
ncbi:ABC transporter substrate-binding protein [Segnochrobactraceae bacterium EtOH-i3]